ncbi:hypothetical protein CL614_02510 [archaeon]|nr:hypothetical protein [archaeon]|tara:strand:+ start:627 stop:986 length:360 start_codon:yes stop_codon:yes gene_type:complete
MSELVVAIDMGSETLSKENKFNEWFVNKGYKIHEETIDNDIVVLTYSVYKRANVVILRYNYEGEEIIFPKIIIEYLEALTDLKGTQVSVAEETPMGYETIIELKLGKFLEAFYKDHDGE